MNLKKTKKPTPKLSPTEKYWDQVDQDSHYLVADTLNQILPLPNLRDKKNLDLDRDADYQEISFTYQNNYAEEKNLPSSENLAEEIAYEYLLLVVKSILRKLSDFSCHIPDYFENLTD